MADPTKWYSAALRAAQNLPQNFGTAEQMNALLAKYGAKASELKYLKVPEYLAQFGGGRVSKNALADYIGENVVLPKENVKGAHDLGKMSEKIANDPALFAGMWRELGTSHQVPSYESLSPEQRLAYVEDHITNLDIPQVKQATKYSDYATYPDSNYKETLVTIPSPKLTNPRNNFQYEGPPLYQSSHWDEPNVLFHTRSSTPGAEDVGLVRSGNMLFPDDKIPFLEELQSDWGQAFRKEDIQYADDIARAKKNLETNTRMFGVDDPITIADREYLQQFDNSRRIKKAPLVTNTNDWASAGVRRFLLEAAEQDAPNIAWTTGAQQSARYQGHAPEGMSGFYDKMIPNILMKYIKPYGGKVELSAGIQKYMPFYADTRISFRGHDTEEEARQWIARNYAPLADEWGDGGGQFSVRPTFSADLSTPHTATLPGPLREKLRKEGIPFFSRGGYLDA